MTVVGLGAGTASAGETTGGGTHKEVNGRSECAFSGQNDGYHDPGQAEGPADAATRVQAFGQIVRFAGPLGGLPGMLCNPNSAPPPPPPA